MSKSKKRLPVTATKSVKGTRALISSHHTLLKRIQQAASNGQSELQRELQSQLEAQGGLQLYQNASLKGGKKGHSVTADWLANYLKEKVSLLDVGAIDGLTFKKYPRFDIHAIDLLSRSPLVVQQDFLTMEPRLFGIVALSLVINYVVAPSDRGLMLTRSKLFLEPGGYLYIVLPLPCISNSRYLDHDRFVFMVTSNGFTLLQHHFSTRLAFYLYQLKDPSQSRPWPKTLLKDSPGHNNFCIVIQ